MYEQAVIAVGNPEAFGTVRQAIENSFSSGRVTEFLSSLQSEKLRIREFEDVLPSIAALDADVLSIESARSRMELLDAFRAHGYPNEIGPGVFDIHSPRVPSTEEMRELLGLAINVLKPEQIWVNPDCGLKTRAWPETVAALTNMCQAAALARSAVSA